MVRKSDRRPWRFTLSMYVIGLALLVSAVPVFETRGLRNALTLSLMAAIILSIFLGWRATEAWKWRQANLPRRETEMDKSAP